ncbi:phospholipase A2 [Nocardioides speluncae]|uniref:phospholipase A2 n=1 Tax=Nocardioides speluncae TaxID=2670337 RepID=UPI0012B16EA5|nr:phospholipase A2 [Nocardioides speluncae]
MHVRTRFTLLLALFLPLLVGVPSGPAVAETSMSSAQLNSLWNAYGDEGGHWTGGDSTTSVPLPDGRIAWLFSDTFLGTVNPDHSRPASTPMVNNTLVVQSGSTLGPTRHGGTTTAPKALVEATESGEFYWVGDGTVTGGKLKVFYNRYKRNSSAWMDISLVGTALVTFDLPSLTVSGIQQLPVGATTTWGSAVLEDGGYTYVYGTEDAGAMKFAKLARVDASLAGSWEFWTGSTWSASEPAATRLLSGVGTAYSVDKINGQYVLTTHDTNVGFGPSVMAHTAPAPTGPFAAPRYLLDAPEASAAQGRYVYDVRTHPELAAAGKLLLSYNSNAFSHEQNLADVRIYRPRFVEVAWPPPAPGAVPAAPSGLTIKGNASPVDLSWTPVSGADSYRVYQRDVTAGQTHFARDGKVFEEPSASYGFLTDGHLYEFRVVAVNAAGESQPSATRTVTVDVAPPPAPTNLRGVVNGDGSVDLSWDAPDVPSHFVVYRRNVSIGETAFSLVYNPDPGARTLTVSDLGDAQEHEFKVAASNGAGEGLTSAPIRLTSRYDKPGAPTSLQATPDRAGGIALTWQQPEANAWYWVYQRDITAGETELKRLEYPVTEGTSADLGGYEDGHEYEFRVAAVNAGGEGPQSTTVRATAWVDKPLAPTGLVATAGTDGSIDLDWDGTGEGLYFWVYQRDVTAGETELVRLELPVTDGTAAELGGFLDGHVYEFTVAAINQGGEGPQSATARATARVTAPAAPTGLSAVPGDGEVALSWTSSGPDAWYWIYQRDVTAGDTEFLRLEYPVTSGSSFTAGLLANGHTYEFKVSAINAGGEGAQSAAVQARPMPPKPVQVTGLTAQARADGSVDLQWTGPTGSYFYWIYRRDVTAGQTGFTKLEYPAENTSFAVEGLTHGHIYEFTVAATNLAGDGPTAAPVRATVDYALPAAPTGLEGETAGDGSVVLSWRPTSDRDLYWVYRRDVTADQVGFTKSALPASDPTATIGPLVHNHVYEFKVSAEGPGGEGPASSTVQVTSKGGLPQPPSGLTADAGNAQVQLSWQASPTPNVMYWVYYRDTVEGDPFRRLELPSSDTSVTVKPLTNGHRYEFRVAATNASGNSAPSGIVSAKPLPPKPAAPTGLEAIGDDHKVGLGWNQTSGANSYRVYYRDASAGQTTWRQYGSARDEWWRTVSGLENGHRYEFRVTALNLAGESSPSAIVSATPRPPAPAAPSGLHATAGNGQVSMSWTASPTSNVYYWVYYRPQGHSQWYYFSKPVYGTSFVARPLYNGFNYEFKVTAANLGGQSGYSNTVTAKPFLPIPSTPVELKATAGYSKVSLDWSAGAIPGAYYWVYFKPEGSSSWYYHPKPVTGTSFVHRSVVDTYTYQYRVTAANAAGQSGYSNTVSATPMPPPPEVSDLRVTNDDRYIGLRWSAPYSTKLTFTVQTKEGTSWRTVVPGRWSMATPGGSPYDETVTFESLRSKQAHEFRVRAENPSGVAYSNTVTVRRPTSLAAMYYSLTAATDASWAKFGEQRLAPPDPWYPWDWSNDGCSTPWWTLIGDSPYDFYFPCIRHDFGYGNHARAGVNGENARARIDYTQLFDMKRECEEIWGSDRSCFRWAHLFYDGVRAFGQDAWED